MTILGVNSPLTMSSVIRWALGSSCSHIAILFDDKWVIHSSVLGVETNWYNTFMKHHSVVLWRSYDLSLEEEEAIYRDILDKYDDFSYDWSGAAYFGFRALLNKLFKIPLPKSNPSKSKSGLLCVTLIEKLPSRFLKRSLDFSIVAPEQIFEVLA